MYSEIIDASLPAIIHPSTRGKMIINYPGLNGDIDGFNAKYRTLGDFLSKDQDLGAFVRIANMVDPARDYAQSVIDDLRAVIRHCLQHSARICGSATPELYLMGFSAGAGAVAAVASEFPEIKKILLVAPAGNAEYAQIVRGLATYSGEIFCAVGENDQVVGPDAADYFSNLAPLATVNKVAVIPNCDHQFRGETNGKVMSALPLWSFAGTIAEPASEHGTTLY